MKQITKSTASIITIALAIIISSCGCRQNNKLSPKTQPANVKHNFVIVLDLSDRLLNSGQGEKDSSMIMAVFGEFEKKARNPLIVTSNDRFAIRIIPQRGSSLLKDSYENRLSIDLSSVDAAHKNASFVTFKEGLSKTISQLYKDAQLGNSAKDYFGVDIWKFFHDEINSELRNDAENKVVVLTDGYFDFNDNSQVISTSNKYTSTSFLNGLKGKDWQAKAEQDSVGLIPVTVKIKAQWIIAGIKAKNGDILMPTKLMYFWKKWLRESGAAEPKVILDNASLVMVGQYCNYN
jgi:hypothetical protein